MGNESFMQVNLEEEGQSGIALAQEECHLQ